jgi:hypothetical protein
MSEMRVPPCRFSPLASCRDALTWPLSRCLTLLANWSVSRSASFPRSLYVQLAVPVGSVSCAISEGTSAKSPATPCFTVLELPHGHSGVFDTPASRREAEPIATVRSADAPPTSNAVVRGELIIQYHMPVWKRTILCLHHGAVSRDASDGLGASLIDDECHRGGTPRHETDRGHPHIQSSDYESDDSSSRSSRRSAATSTCQN